MSRYEDLKKKSNGTTQGQKEEEQEEQSRYQSIKQSRGNRSYGVDNDYINAFIQDANNFFTTSQNDYNNLTWQSGTDKEKSKSRSDTMADLRSRSANIRAFVNANKSMMDESAYNELVSVLNQIDSGRENVFQSFYKAEQFYSKYQSQYDYDKSMEEAEAVAKKLSELTNGYDPGKNRAEGQAGWLAYREYVDDSIRESEERRKAQEAKDAEKKSQGYTFMQFLEDFGRHSYGNPDTSLPLHIDVNQASKEIQDKDAQLRSPKDNWTDEQRETFGYLWNTEREKSYEYAYAVNTALAVQAEKEEIAKIQNWSKQNVGTGILSTAGAIVTAPFGLADYLYDMLEYGAIGHISEGDGNITPFEYSQAVTSGVSQHLNEIGGTLSEDIPIIGGKGWGDAYGLGTSILQSSASAITGGSGQALITFFGSGAASGVDDAVKRGATGEEALLYGTAMGTAEALAENIGLDNLLKMGSSATARQFLWNLLKQAGIEGLEEGVTAFMGNVADNLIMGDKTNFYLRYEAYRRAGLDEDEAKEKAWLEMAEDVAFDMLGGFASGGIHAGPKTAYHTYNQNKYYKNTYGGSQQELVGEALEIDPDNKFAQRMQGRLDKGKNLSGGQLNRLVQQNDSTLSDQDMSKIQKAIEARLVELGEKGDVSSLASALAKQAKNQVDYQKVKNEITRLMAEGHSYYEAFEMADQSERQELTPAEEKLIAESKFGQRVANELDIENIRSGNYASAWAENIGTEKIHANAYNRTAEATEMPQETPSGSKIVTKKAPENLQVSEDGKVYDPNGNEINIVGVESTADGKLTLKTEDGAIDYGDVQYASDNDALVYDAVAKMSASPESAWAMIKAFNASDGITAEQYATAAPLAYTYGKLGYKNGLFKDGKPALALTATQSAIAYQMGRSDAKASVKATSQASAESLVSDKNADKHIIFEGFTYSRRAANEVQRASMDAIHIINKLSNLEVHVYQSVNEGGTRYAVINGKKRLAPNGYFTDGNKVYIDINAGADGRGVMLYTMSHEIGHYIAKWNAADFKVISDFLFEHYGEGAPILRLIDAKKETVKKSLEMDGKPIPGEAELERMAQEELVCDMLSRMLSDKYAYDKLMELKQKDLNVFQKLGKAIKNLLDKLAKALGIYDSQTPDFLLAVDKEMFGEEAFRQLQDLYIKAFVQADANYASQVGGEVDIDGDPNTHLMSDRSIIEGAGLQFIPDADGTHYKVLDADGNEVKSVTHEMIADSPLGDLVTIAKDNGFLGNGKQAEQAATKQYKFLADLVNMCIRYDGIAPIWETAGTMVFSSIKSNADKQYGLTIDFSTVCKKTQAIVDAMSEAMVRLGRGLTRSEVETIYLEVGKAGESTPCPVCYVFSRWMGIGGILDQINRFQDKYYGMSETKIQAFMSDVKGRIEERVNTPNSSGKLKADFFDKNGAIKEGNVIADLKQKANSKAASALKAIAKNADYQLQIQELEVLMENQDAKEAKKTAKKIEKLQAKVVDASQLESQFKHYNDVVEEYEAYQWLTRTLMKEENGKWVKNEAFKPVPPEVLFDLNNGATFAEEYPLSWAFRTGKGASAGKAITPYADARVGEAIQGIASQDVKSIKTGIDLNPFLNGDKKARQDIINKAIVKQARQNLIGGQRYQSTSDFRYEYGSDYLITFLEMQAIGAKVQLYTKVIEAVDFLASMGADVNLSVMPLSNGFVTLPNGKKKLIYSSVTGIDKDAALTKVHEYDNVQLILVGISDEHIRLALEGEDVTFVIPFHGSGNTVHQIQVLMNLLGENLDVTTAQDYTAVQSDHVSPKQTKEQKALWDLRVKIITGKASTLSTAEQALLERNTFLQDLHRRFYIDKSADEYGISLTSDQANQIFPYEYWDKSLTYAEADMNGERFKEYCASMGIIPRFSGKNSKGESVGFGDFTGDKGYWKLLIDRRMYDNTYDSEGNWTGYGKYHVQKRINCSDFQVKHLDPEYGSATYGDVMSKANDPRKTSAIVDRAIAQFENKGTVYSERDTAYLDAVNRGDMETAQRMVDEAAKRAGFPVKLFHGTYGFGFTKVKTAGVEPGVEWSPFFATSNIYTAMTYSGVSTQTEIGNRKRPVKSIGGLRAEASALLTNPQNATTGFVNAEHRDTYIEQYGSIMDADTIKLIKGGAEGAFAIDGGDTEFKFVPYEEGFSAEDYESKRGNYGLYANTDGFLIVDGEGREWNRLRSEYGSTTRLIAKNALDAGYKGVKITNVYDTGMDWDVSVDEDVDTASDVYIFFKPQEQVKSADPVTYDDNGDVIPLSERFNQKNDDIRYSERDTAPTFYSQMAKVVDGVKQEKLGAASVVSMLRGKGVKAEEIKWSGIEAWLEGKKSVTKAELQEFIGGSMLQIDEVVLDGSKPTNIEVKKAGLFKNKLELYVDGKLVDTYTKDMDGAYVSKSNPNQFYTDEAHLLRRAKSKYNNKLRPGNEQRWSKHKLDGGTNYREFVFSLPGATYSNDAMFNHWRNAKGVLAHARVQDFEVDGKKMLFVEEIQSDWHNEGHKAGYSDGKIDANIAKLKATAEEAFYAVEDYSTEMTGMAGEWDAIEKTDQGAKLLREYREAKAAYENAMDEAVKKVPDAPFKDTYHEFVLKRLIREAAENGYDSIGWTTADLQMERWNPKRQTNAELGVQDAKNPDAVAFEEGYRNEYDRGVPKFLIKYGKQWGAEVGKTEIDTRGVSEWEQEMVEKGIIELVPQMTEVWSMDITPAMKESVLTEGQPLYSERVLMGSLFSGGGTLEAGLAYQMLDKEFGVEYDGKIASVYADNHGDHIQVGKVEDFDISKYDDIFYLHASPVCHNFSKAKHGAKELEMDINSAKATAKHLETAMPQVFTVENAPGYRKSESLKIITDKLTELGYKWDVDVYNSADYGSATSRNRVILRAVKDGELPAKPEKQERTNSWDKVTRDLWETLPKSYLRPSFISAIENTRNLPILDADGKVNVNKPLLILTTTSGHTVTYCWEGDICPTLTTKCGEARLVMPDGNIYAVTPEFMGRIQGLPDDYKYPKEKTRAFTIIGNGIPTHLTKAVVGGVLDSAYEQTHDGQALYQEREEDSVSNRSLLANAFEGIAKPEELQKIKEYKDKVELINAEEKKLRELNAEIKKLSFAEGKRDTKKIRDLRDEATMTSNRINTLDKQLLRLEAAQPLQDVLTREKKRAYDKAVKEGRKALDAYKEKTAKTQRELLNKWKESRKKAVESHERTVMRNKIRSVVGELNELLLNEDKKHHVPDNLKKAVASALALVNMDTVKAEERAAKYAALIAKETDPDKIDAYTVTMENILRQGEKMGQKLKELRDAYEEIQNSDDPDIANGYDPAISGAISELSQSIGDTSLANMSIEQLSDVYDMYKMVLTKVRDANKSLIESIKESISNRASRVVGEVRRVGGEHKYRASILDPIRTFFWNNAKPVYAMEHIGSEAMTEAYNQVRKGEDTWAKDVTEARAYYLDKSKKYGYDSWDFDKKYTFKSASEQEFELTLEQILSLYAYSKREQAHDHLRLGGFVFDSNIETYTDKGSKLLKYKVNTADAHQITPEILANIIGTLTTEQMGFVDEMQNYLSTVMGAKGNEVTMKMYGVKLFKEKFYFPLKSAKQFMFEQNEVSGEVRIKNSGFTNKVVAKANNPVILNNFMDVWANHVNDMSMYHSFVLPLEDFNRIFNYNSPKQEGVPAVSVKGTIQNAYSPAAVNYVKQLITDLNGGARSDPRETFAKSLTARWKKAKVFSSLSVVIQQPSAIGRAFALVDPKYFHPTKDGMNHDELWAELKKYAPVAVIKEMGYFDVNMGRSTLDFIKAKEYSTFKEKAKAFFVDGDYRDELLSKAPALADELSWCAIWNAVKRETLAKNPGLDIKSEPFLMLAGARFTEVITKTQVYDSVLARSANMRSKSGLMSMVTSFMAEPTTSINMLEDALRKGKRGFKGYAGRAFASVAVSVILNNALVALVYGMRDDDEDETFAEKYMQSFVSNMMDDINPLTYLPYLKDMWSLLQGYDIERTDMSLASDLADGLKGLVQAYSSEDGDVVGAWHDMVGAIANIGGVPLDNIRRDVNGAINFFNTIIEDVNGRETTWGSMGDALEDEVRGSLPVVGWLSGETKADKLYDAIISGDTAYVNRLKGSYKDEDAYHNAVRTALRENDPRIKEAAIAGFNGNPSERVRIAKLIIADGFAQDDVVAAINAEINKMKPDEASNPKAKGFYTAEDFAIEIANGDQATANAIKVDVIQTAQKNGKSAEEAEKAFNSSAKRELKELYMAGKLSKDKVINALTTYCGAERDDALDDVGEWDFEADHPELDGKITYTQYKRWQADGKPNGVTIELFTKVAEFRDNGTSDSVKSQDEVMAYIMSVTSDVSKRHALWCCFYKASTSPFD